MDKVDPDGAIGKRDDYWRGFVRDGRPTEDEALLLAMLKATPSADWVWGRFKRELVCEQLKRDGFELVIKHTPCPHRVMGKRCDGHAADCWRGDHDSLWKHETGAWLFTSEPYQLELDALEALCRMARRHDLHVSIDGGGSGWFNGPTFCIKVMTRAGFDAVLTELRRGRLN